MTSNPLPSTRFGGHVATSYFLYLGGIIPFVFAGILVVCGIQMGNYNHLTRMVSELGAIGTTTQFMFTAGLVLCSLLSLLFVVGLFRVCKEINISSFPVIMILSFSISIFGAGIFPLPLRMHLISGMPSVLLILSPLFSLLLWRNSRRLPGIRLMSLLSFLVMSLGFLAFFPEVWGGYPGLKQRFFHMGWAIWFFSLSYLFVKLQKLKR